jgi:hypothetical protein
VCERERARKSERERRERGEATITLYAYIEQVESGQTKKKISPF